MKSIIKDTSLEESSKTLSKHSAEKTVVKELKLYCESNGSPKLAVMTKRTQE